LFEKEAQFISKYVFFYYPLCKCYGVLTYCTLTWLKQYL